MSKSRSTAWAVFDLVVDLILLVGMVIAGIRSEWTEAIFLLMLLNWHPKAGVR